MLRGSDLDTSGNGIAPRQLVESMAERQVNALLHAAARTWPPGTLPALRSWALALARGPVLTALLHRFAFDAIVCTKTLEVERICASESVEAILERIFGGEEQHEHGG